MEKKKKTQRINKERRKKGIIGYFIHTKKTQHVVRKGMRYRVTSEE